jgi:hypothetical protein
MLCKIWGFHGVTTQKTPFFYLNVVQNKLIPQ